MNIKVTVNGTTLTAQMENNSSADALCEKLKEENIIVHMKDYANFEKVGPLGSRLPSNDRQYTTKPGDIILYMGDQLVFYYDKNTWNFTKLGEFQNVTKADLKKLFGKGDITAELSL
ncbi:MAG: hypothetical protein LUF78_07640 [Clostridiales bacterium]|nr:hypothetical protein [Clostridiales bacterium]